MGYDENRKGWRCCDPTTSKCYISQNVVFDETSSWWTPKYIVLPHSNKEEQLHEKYEEQSIEVQQSPEQSQPQERP